jgi:hypothetical protein
MEIEDNQCFISKAALSVLNFVSKADFNQALRSVCIRNGKILCADGFILGQSNVIQGKNFPNCLLKPDEFKISKVGIFHWGVGLLITHENKQYTIEGTYKIIATEIKDASMPPEKPLFKRVADNKDCMCVTLNPNVMSTLLKATKTSGQSYFVMRISKPSKIEPYPIVEFITYQTYKDKSEQGVIQGLLMPVASDSNTYNWYSDTVKVEDKNNGK